MRLYKDREHGTLLFSLYKNNAIFPSQCIVVFPNSLLFYLSLFPNRITVIFTFIFRPNPSLPILSHFIEKKFSIFKSKRHPMEETQQGNSPKTDEKQELGFSSPSPSPPPPPSVDVSDLEKLDLDLQNLWLKEDDWNIREQVSIPKDEKKRRFSYPLRPGEPDCLFYLRTGSCRFATNCKFNHPRRRKNQVMGSVRICSLV